MNYQEFLKQKEVRFTPSGFDPGDINPKLFNFQRDIVKWMIRRGRAAGFEDCGLGKTAQELEWLNQIHHKTGDNVLLLTPPAVADQTCREAKKFGIDSVKHCKEQSEVEEGITITNYQKLHKFDLDCFKAIALDESSILKSYDGHYCQYLIDKAKTIPYRSSWTATPSPNDIMELGNQCDFLGIMSRSEMLAMFFTHDGGETSKWRLKHHAEQDFWKWLCSWAVNIRKPSDLGYSDDGFTLPKLNIQNITVESNCQSIGFLFPLPASSLKERRDARRGSLNERVKTSADIVNKSNEQWLVWCDLNDESQELTKLIDGAIEVTGSDSDDEKSKAMLKFTNKEDRVLVSKSSICGFGMNWQQSHNSLFCGLSDSYEKFYQAVRRQYRFGQKQQVNVIVVTSNLEQSVVSNIQRKQADSDKMANEMVKHMAKISSSEIKGTTRTQTIYNPNQTLVLPSWIN